MILAWEMNIQISAIQMIQIAQTHGNLWIRMNLGIWKSSLIRKVDKFLSLYLLTLYNFLSLPEVWNLIGFKQ